MMLLAGGGIGVTPIMGILKDVFDIGLNIDPKAASHRAIDTIYFWWIMPGLTDYDSFRDELNQCMERSKLHGYPKFVPSIYITRSKELLQEPFHSGRPNVNAVFKSMLENHLGDAGLVFVCGPQPLVTELWDKSIQCTASGHCIDFHHEIFDF